MGYGSINRPTHTIAKHLLGICPLFIIFVEALTYLLNDLTELIVVSDKDLYRPNLPMIALLMSDFVLDLIILTR